MVYHYWKIKLVNLKINNRLNSFNSLVLLKKMLTTVIFPNCCYPHSSLWRNHRWCILRSFKYIKDDILTVWNASLLLLGALINTLILQESSNDSTPSRSSPSVTPSSTLLCAPALLCTFQTQPIWGFYKFPTPLCFRSLLIHCCIPYHKTM